MKFKLPRTETFEELQNSFYTYFKAKITAKRSIIDIFISFFFLEIYLDKKMNTTKK